jgi:hypothetical protein
LSPGDDAHPVGLVPFALSLVLDEVHQALQLRAFVIARGGDRLTANHYFIGTLALTCPTSCCSLLTGRCQQLNFARGCGSTCQGFSMKFLCSVCLETNFSWNIFDLLESLALSKHRSKTFTALSGHLS